MPNPILNKLQLVGFKTEVTQNTAIALLATDYILTEVSQPKPVYEVLKREYAHLTLDQIAHVIGKVYCEFKLKVELKGNGSSSHAPLHALLKSIGLSLTDTGTAWSLVPITTEPTNMLSCAYSLTTSWSLKGFRQLIAGCVAHAAKITLQSGKIGFLEMTLRGIYSAPTNTAFASPTYNETLPPKFESATLTVDSDSDHVVDKLDIDFGIETSLRENANATDGVGGFIIVDRKPNGSFDPELRPVSGTGSYDYSAKIKAATEVALSCILGQTNGNKLTFSLPKIQYLSLDHGDRSGKAIGQIPFSINKNAGDDWITITFPY